MRMDNNLRSLCHEGADDDPQRPNEQKDETEKLLTTDVDYELNNSRTISSERNSAGSSYVLLDGSQLIAQIQNGQLDVDGIYISVHSDDAQFLCSVPCGRNVSDVVNPRYVTANPTAPHFAPSISGRLDPLRQQFLSPRRNEDGFTPLMDTPDANSEDDGADVTYQQQHGNMDIQELPALPHDQDGFYPEIDKQQADGNPASNYVFSSIVHFSSNRVIDFQDNGIDVSGRINISGYQHLPIHVETNESSMRFSFTAVDNNKTDEVHVSNVGEITFPRLIQRQTFEYWYEESNTFLCFCAKFQ